MYERFLGKVIRLTAGHQARVEEKPEVRKAGGVYYTPTYIVEYIVKNTVGELLKDKDPAALKSAPLRVLDPACGSGSFLLGAYQYLLDWYLDWYVQHEPAKWGRGKNPPIFEIRDGSWQLTMEKKKEILTSHIYGVDIDAQAVEVTKLSLLLKVVENPGQLGLLTERILPDLGENIQCGNSLIGPDYYDGQQLTMFDNEEQYRVNAFDWQAAFPQVLRDGGFDAVIGNPPYIRIQAMKEWAPTEVEFYKKRYKAASKGNYDIYVVFVEKGLSLLNREGRLGFILPHKFFNAQYGEPLRGLIGDNKYLSKVVHFGDQQVFENATTYTCLLFLGMEGWDDIEFEKVIDLDTWQDGIRGLVGLVDSDTVNNSAWNFEVGEDAELFSKINQLPTKLSDIALRIFQGIKTSADKIFIVMGIERNGNLVKVYSKEKDEMYLMEANLLHPLIKGGDSERYHLSNTDRLILFPYMHQEGKGYLLIPENAFKKDYPLTWKYLVANKNYLENRENGKMKGTKWYGYIYPKNFDVMHLPKIFTPDIAPSSSFSLDETGEVFFTGGAAGGYGLLISQDYSREYILGLLNSKLLEWILQKIATTMRGGWYSYESRFISNLPIRAIDFTNPADVKRHDRMVSLVESMLSLHKQSAAARLPDEKERLERQIQATDRQIDRLVYELYGLTEEEIKIVESA